MKIQIWPNGLGANVQSGRLAIEVWEHGGCRRLERDNSLTGSHGTHYARVPRADLPQMCRDAVDLWITSKAAWTPCE